MSASLKIWRGTVFVTGANVMARVGTFLGNLVIIRLLGLESTGVLGLVEAWLALVTVFTVFGLNSAVTRYVAHDLEADSERVGASAGSGLLLSFGFSLLVSLVLYLVMGLVAAGSAPGTTAAILNEQSALLVCLVVVYTVKYMVLGLAYGLQTFQVLLWANCAVGLASLPLSYLLVSRQGLAGALVVRLLLALVETGLMWAGLRGHLRRLGIRLSLHDFRENAQRLLGFGFPTFVGQLIANPVQPLMMSFLAAQPGGVAQVGLLTTGQRLVGLVAFFPGSMAATIMPVLAGEWGRGDLGRFRQSVEVALRMLWLASLPFVLFFMAISPALLAWLYGSEYVAGWPLAFLFLAISLMAAVNETADRSLAAAGRAWLSTANNAIWGGLFLVLGWLLVPRSQGLGYALAFAVSFAIYLALQFGSLKLLFGMPARFLLPMAVFSALMVLLALVSASVLPYAAQVAAASALTLFTVLVLWHFFLNAAEKKRVQQRARQVFGRAALLMRALRASAGWGTRGPE